jgi:hypothetical protein
MRSRIMFLESKAEGLSGPARIGRVTFSKTGRTVYYRDLSFRRVRGGGVSGNYCEVESGDEYWISGPHKDGLDRLYGGAPIDIDEDVRHEYWTVIRGRREHTG